MSFIDETWLRTAFQSLAKTLDFDPQTKRDAIQFLLDEHFWDGNKLSWEAAVARWNSCLNPNKPEFFKIGELWALMRRFGRHQFFLAMAEDLGYEVRLKPTEERRMELLGALEQATARMETQLAELRAQLSRVDQVPPPAKPVGPNGATRHFSVSDDATAVDRIGCP